MTDKADGSTATASSDAIAGGERTAPTDGTITAEAMDPEFGGEDPESQSASTESTEPTESSTEASTESGSGGEDELPEKYKGKSAAEIARMHQELEKKLGEKSGESQDESDKPGPENIKKDDDGSADASTEEGQKEAEEAVNKAGLDFQEVSQEFWQNGQLSDETYKKLEEGGIPRQAVDQYIEGQRALAEKHTQSVYEAVGGQEQYQSAVEWARSNMAQEDINLYNSEINSGDPRRMKMAATSLMAQYQQANGVEAEMVEGGKAASAGGDAYQSHEEFMADVESEKYDTDPAFRKKVADKLARSNI